MKRNVSEVFWTSEQFFRLLRSLRRRAPSDAPPRSPPKCRTVLSRHSPALPVSLWLRRWLFTQRSSLKRHLGGVSAGRCFRFEMSWSTHCSTRSANSRLPNYMLTSTMYALSSTRMSSPNQVCFKLDQLFFRPVPHAVLTNSASELCITPTIYTPTLLGHPILPCR